jgi:hypothetical protein
MIPLAVRDAGTLPPQPTFAVCLGAGFLAQNNPGFFDDRHFGLLMGCEEDLLQKWK